jgi:hypothetical protein
MSDVPSNLVPTRITQLPEYLGSETTGYMPYVYGGITYKVQFSNIAAVGAVPSSRTISAGTGLTGGGDLSQNRVIAVADGGIGYTQLDVTGVTAGTYGTATTVPQFYVDAKGRIDSVVEVPIVLTGYVPSTRTITAGTGLSGGGALSSNITVSINFSSATPEPLGVASAGTGTQAAREDHVHPAVDLASATEVQGVLPLSSGGTGNSLSPIAGAVVYSTGEKFNLTNAGNAGGPPGPDRPYRRHWRDGLHRCDWRDRPHRAYWRDRPDWRHWCDRAHRRRRPHRPHGPYGRGLYRSGPHRPDGRHRPDRPHRGGLYGRGAHRPDWCHRSHRSHGSDRRHWRHGRWRRAGLLGIVLGHHHADRGGCQYGVFAHAQQRGSEQQRHQRRQQFARHLCLRRRLQPDVLGAVSQHRQFQRGARRQSVAAQERQRQLGRSCGHEQQVHDPVEAWQHLGRASWHGQFRRFAFGW